MQASLWQRTFFIVIHCESSNCVGYCIRKNTQSDSPQGRADGCSVSLLYVDIQWSCSLRWTIRLLDTTWSVRLNCISRTNLFLERLNYILVVLLWPVAWMSCWQFDRHTNQSIIGVKSKTLVLKPIYNIS